MASSSGCPARQVDCGNHLRLALSGLIMKLSVLSDMSAQPPLLEDYASNGCRPGEHGRCNNQYDLNHPAKYGSQMSAASLPCTGAIGYWMGVWNVESTSLASGDLVCQRLRGRVASQRIRHGDYCLPTEVCCGYIRFCAGAMRDARHPADFCRGSLPDAPAKAP